MGQKEKDGVEGGREDKGWGSATVAAVTSPAWETKVSMAQPPLCLASELKGPYAQEPSHFHGHNKYLLTNSQYLLVHSLIHLFDNIGLPW